MARADAAGCGKVTSRGTNFIVQASSPDRNNVNRDNLFLAMLHRTGNLSPQTYNGGLPRDLTFEPCKTPELMDPSSVYAYDSYSNLEYMGFPNSPAAIGSIGRQYFVSLLPILHPSRFLTIISLQSPLTIPPPAWARCPLPPATRPTPLADLMSPPLPAPALLQVASTLPPSLTLALAGCLRTACDPEGAAVEPFALLLPSLAMSDTTPSLNPRLV